jgi:hypothetical protein
MLKSAHDDFSRAAKLSVEYEHTPYQNKISDQSCVLS